MIAASMHDSVAAMNRHRAPSLLIKIMEPFSGEARPRAGNLHAGTWRTRGRDTIPRQSRGRGAGLPAAMLPTGVGARRIAAAAVVVALAAVATGTLGLNAGMVSPLPDEAWLSARAAVLPMHGVGDPNPRYAAPKPESTAPSGDEGARGMEGLYARLPLFFERATARLGGDAAGGYVARGPGYWLNLRSDRVDAMFHTGPETPRNRRVLRDGEATGGRGAGAAGRQEFAAHAWRSVRLQFLGGKRGASVAFEEAMPGWIHHLRGHGAGHSRHSTRMLGKVGYRDVYPGIDIAHYGTGGELEFDWIVRPGADPTQIRMRIEGADEIQCQSNGDITLKVADRQVRLKRPVVYQTFDGTGREHRRRVDAAYRLVGADQVVFALDEYDRGRDLVIDPVLSYATFLGGSGTDRAWSLSVDPDGNTYVTGETDSVSFPADPGGGAFPGYSGTLSIGGDCYVAKIKADGSGLEFFTYLGGKDYDGGLGLALGPDRSVYVTGFTASPDFPVTDGVLQGVNRSTVEPFTGIFQLDGFVARLAADGASLVYSTYLGGENEDLGIGIAVDAGGNAFVTGETSSADFPVRNPLMAPAGGKDLFVSKVNPAGTELVFSTTLGGSFDDSGQGVAVDGGGNTYVGGLSLSADFPVQSPVQPDWQGGYEGVLLKLAPPGDRLVYSTYLGGSADDQVFRVALAEDRSLIVTGRTSSADFPAVRAVQPEFGGFWDAFLARLNPAGDGYVFATFLGGSVSEAGWGVAVDGNRGIFIAGSSNSTDLPVKNPLQEEITGLENALVAGYSMDGQTIDFVSYLGSDNTDTAYDVAVASDGTLHIGGRTELTATFPVTGDGLQPTFGGGFSDSFVARIIRDVRLRGSIANGQLTLSWPRTGATARLQSTMSLAEPRVWVDVASAPSLVNGQWTVTLDPAGRARFYRLLDRD